MSFRFPPKKAPVVVQKDPNAPEIALCAITSSNKQKEVSDFVCYVLEALQRNSFWINDLVSDQDDFKCALMVGAGPNRFQLQEILFPSSEEDIDLNIELRDSEDHDKIAFAALFRLSNSDTNVLMKYIKRKVIESKHLREDLMKGSEMGVSFAILRPISDKQYRVSERIQVGLALRNSSPRKRRDERSIVRPYKRARRVV